VDEALVSELESAIADTGALLVRARKYQRGAGPEGDGLAHEALALGDTARRLHRQAALDDAAAGRLLREARNLADRLRALVAEIHGAADYRAAVAAHAAGDHEALARLLPAIFAGLEPATVEVGDLFAPVAWLRRGRLRPAGDVAREVIEARTAGLPAEGDDLSPGADAALPAVVLSDVPPDEPVVLRLGAGTVGGPVHRLSDSGDHLVHVPRLLAAPVVRLARRLQLDEQPRVEIAPGDWADFRDALAAALDAAGVPVEDA
jgi:hypothetical protein